MYHISLQTTWFFRKWIHTNDHCACNSLAALMAAAIINLKTNSND
jgi:hypothetical protein